MGGHPYRRWGVQLWVRMILGRKRGVRDGKHHEMATENQEQVHTGLWPFWFTLPEALAVGTAFHCFVKVSESLQFELLDRELCPCCCRNSNVEIKSMV